MRSWKMLLAVVAYLYANHALALGGIADLSVYDRTEGRQLQVHWHEGRAYVVGKPGNEYQVTLRSKLREEVLAVVCRAHRAADQELGTGHGRREDSPARYVSFERATSAPTELVTLYYDSYRNLLARGVIRQPVPVAPLPRPFPDFVPDPRG